MFEDYGSNRAMGSAALLLVGGMLITAGTWFGYQDGLRHPIALLLGILSGGYFLISGTVRVIVGVLTRRGER